MKNKIRLFYILLVFNVSLFVLVNILYLGIMDIRNYENKYERYDISQRTNVSKYESNKIINQTMDYIVGGQGVETISNYYNDYEIEHIIDIYEMFYVANMVRKIIFWIIIFQIIILNLNKKLLNEINLFKKYLNINYILIFSLIVMVIINFKKYFIYFHKILFKNDYWLLNPDTDLLIQLMPEVLFSNVLIKLILIYILIILMIQLFIFLLDKKMKLGYNLDE